MIPDYFDKIIDSAIENSEKIYVEELKIWFDNKLEQLVNNGQVYFKDDKFLGGKALEVRVRNIFKSIGFNVAFDKRVDSDGILQPNENFEIKKPIVLEIKSSNSNGPSRKELRQLDDYIFEISGEEKARKEGLGKTGYHFDPLAGTRAKNFVKDKKYFHPSPHKGLMIFNNSNGNHFKDSFTIDLGHNELEFVKKRNICVISFKDFLDFTCQIEDNKLPLSEFWNRIHKTEGLLKQNKLPLIK